MENQEEELDWLEEPVNQDYIVGDLEEVGEYHEDQHIASAGETDKALSIKKHLYGFCESWTMFLVLPKERWRAMGVPSPPPG